MHIMTVKTIIIGKLKGVQDILYISYIKENIKIGRDNNIGVSFILFI